jgi:hypothetical protein
LFLLFFTNTLSSANVAKQSNEEPHQKMALTNNLLASLLARGTGDRSKPTAAATPPTPRPLEDDDAQSIFAVTQDEQLSFPLADAGDNINNADNATATPTMMQAMTTTSAGMLLKLIQKLAMEATPSQSTQEFRWQQTTRTDAMKFKEEVLVPSSRPRVFGFPPEKVSLHPYSSQPSKIL